MTDELKQELDNINTGKTRPKNREELEALKARKVEIVQALEEDLTNTDNL